MGLDIRNPIGLMFAIIGIVLVAFGLFSDKEIYQRSLGINMNLIWGVILFVFGALMMGLAKLASSRQAAREKEKPSKNKSSKISVSAGN